MTLQPYYEDPEWKRVQRRLLAGGVALVSLMGGLMLSAWPEPAGPGPPDPDDLFLAGPDAPLVVRMTAEDGGRTVATRREVSAFRSRLAELGARCGDLPEDEVAAIVDRTRTAVRSAGRPTTHARTIAELSFQVELAGDSDCEAASREVAGRR